MDLGGHSAPFNSMYVHLTFTDSGSVRGAVPGLEMSAVSRRRLGSNLSTTGGWKWELLGRGCSSGRSLIRR